MRLRHALVTAALAATSAVPFVLNAGPVAAQGGGCPAGFASVAPEAGRQLVATASGVPAGCVNVTCPTDLIPVSPFADGGSPAGALGAVTAGSSSSAGCFPLAAAASAVAPLVLSVGSQTSTAGPVSVGGAVENRTAAPSDVLGGIRPSSVGSSVLARTGADSGTRAKEAAALVGAGTLLMFAAAWHLRSSRRQEVAALTLG